MKVTKTLLALALVAAAAVQGTEAAHQGICGVPANECSKLSSIFINQEKEKKKKDCHCERAKKCVNAFVNDPAKYGRDLELSMQPRHLRDEGVEGAKGDLAECDGASVKVRDLVVRDIGNALADLEMNPETSEMGKYLQGAIQKSEAGKMKAAINMQKALRKYAVQTKAKKEQEEEARQAAIAEQERIKEAREKELMEGALGQWGGLVQNKKALKQKFAQRILDTHMERRQKRLMGYDLKRELDTKTAESIELKHNQFIGNNRRAANTQKPIADALKQAKGPVYVDVSPWDVAILDDKHMYVEQVPYSIKQEVFGKKAFPDRREIRDKVTGEFMGMEEAHIAESVTLKVIKYDRVHNCLVIETEAGKIKNVQVLDVLPAFAADSEESVSGEEEGANEEDGSAESF